MLFSNSLDTDAEYTIIPKQKYCISLLLIYSHKDKRQKEVSLNFARYYSFQFAQHINFQILFIYNNLYIKFIYKNQ